MKKAFEKTRTIHLNDRNQAYVKYRESEKFFYKRNYKNSAFYAMQEKLASQIFYEANKRNDLILKYHIENDFLVCRWLDSSFWLPYKTSFSSFYESVGSFIINNNNNTSLDSLSIILTDSELYYFLETKKRLIDVHEFVARQLKIFECGLYWENYKDAYLEAFQYFVLSNNQLLHCDLVTSNLLIYDNNLKIIDFEFSTLGPPEYDVARLISAMLMVVIESRRKGVPFNEMNSLFDNISAFIQKVSCCVDLNLVLHQIGFHMLKIIFIHHNNFTKIINKNDYLRYFIPYSCEFLKYKGKAIHNSFDFVFVIKQIIR